MKKVITYGTFDLLHYGHILLLQRAKAFGDHLTVALSTDDFNRLKGKAAYFSYEKRKMMLEAIKCVDEVIPETCWEQKTTDIQRLGISVFVMGNDWEGKFDELRSQCEVIYLARTPNISTTSIKSELQHSL